MLYLLFCVEKRFRSLHLSMCIHMYDIILLYYIMFAFDSVEAYVCKRCERELNCFFIMTTEEEKNRQILVLLFPFYHTHACTHIAWHRALNKEGSFDLL